MHKKGGDDMKGANVSDDAVSSIRAEAKAALNALMLRASATPRSPRTIEEIEDELDYAEALNRIAHFDPDKLISEEEMNRRMGITEDDLKDFDKVEIE